MASYGLELSLRVLFLSDTIVIGAVMKPLDNDVERQDEADATAVLTVGAIVSQIQIEALQMRVPLMYRGCISFGSFKLTEKFIVGVAVDEAAASMDSADAALVWCTPSAARIVSGSKSRLATDIGVSPRLFLKDRVPLKGGRLYNTWVVSPFRALEPGVASRKAFLKAAGATFGRDVIEHEIKRQNTIAVLGAEDKRLRLSEDLVQMKARRVEREAAKQRKS